MSIFAAVKEAVGKISSPFTVAQLAQATGLRDSQINSVLHLLQKTGRIRRLDRHADDGVHRCGRGPRLYEVCQPSSVAEAVEQAAAEAALAPRATAALQERVADLVYGLFSKRRWWTASDVATELGLETAYELSLVRCAINGLVSDPSKKIARVLEQVYQEGAGRPPIRWTSNAAYIEEQERDLEALRKLEAEPEIA